MSNDSEEAAIMRMERARDEREHLRETVRQALARMESATERIRNGEGQAAIDFEQAAKDAREAFRRLDELWRAGT